MADRTEQFKAGRKPHPRVLLLYFSQSGQTQGLLSGLCNGLKEAGVQVTLEKLVLKTPQRFPFGSVRLTLKRMIVTFFRQRLLIRELAPACFQPYDLIILAGPTWSYNPSGPVLTVLDRDGRRLFKGRQVLPLISCRGYWRMHWLGLKRLLEQRGARVDNLIVFSHPNPEPCRTIGVFLKLAGRHPERTGWISRYYKHYGHSAEQRDEAWRFGLQIGEALKRQTSLASLDFKTPVALP